MMTKEGGMDSTGRNGRKRMMVDEWSLNSSPPRQLERSSLQLRDLALNLFTPCIRRALPVVAIQYWGGQGYAM